MAESCEIGEENGQARDGCNLLEYRLCRFLIFRRVIKRSKNFAWNGILKSILCQISSDFCKLVKKLLNDAWN